MVLQNKNPINTISEAYSLTKEEAQDIFNKLNAPCDPDKVKMSDAQKCHNGKVPLNCLLLWDSKDSMEKAEEHAHTKNVFLDFVDN